MLLTLSWIIAAIVWGRYPGYKKGQGDDAYQNNALEPGIGFGVLFVAWLGLLIFRYFAPLNARFIWSVDGDEKTIDRTAAHHSVIQLGTSNDEAARERQYGASQLRHHFVPFHTCLQPMPPHTRCGTCPTYLMPVRVAC